MSTQEILKSLTEKGIITEEKATQVADYEAIKPFSVHWELRTILYLGIVIFTTGLGMLVYKNIDTVGHDVLIVLTAILTVACFIYVYQKRQPFSWQEVKNPSKFVDYILLLGCTLFLILEGYLQYRHRIFGTRYGLATFIPAVLFFICAYCFDHKGVLSMAITALASWLGLAIAPLSLLEKNDFTDPQLVITATILGLILVGISWFSEQKELKKHFSYTYLLLGGNLASIATLIGLFSNDFKLIYLLIIVGLCYYFIYYARRKQSFIFLLMGVIFGYAAFSYAIFHFLPDEFGFFFGSIYFLATSAGVILFLLNVKKILGTKK